MTGITVRFDPKSNLVTKCKLECDVGGKGLALVLEEFNFEALSDLCPYTIVDLHEVG